MTKTCTAAAAVLVAAFSLPALAQAPRDPAATPGIDKRQANQQQRIDKGVQSGQLNERETKRLEKGQARVQKMEDRAKEDGKVTAKERARIQRQQNVQSRKIARQRHDKQRAK